MLSLHESIKSSLSQCKQGSVVFPGDFRGRGTEGAIKMALSRLAREGAVERVAHGVYYVPYIDPVLGKLSPPPEEFAEKLAEKEKIRIRPTGVFALNKLGLSTQVPTRLVYLTDGHPRKLKIGKANIEFKATSPKKMALSGEVSSMLILALSELDLNYLSKEQEARIIDLLQVMDQKELEEDMRLAPAKVYNYLFKLRQKLDIKPLV